MEQREQLIGVWHCAPYPTRETTLTLYPDGQGLLFFVIGSEDPIVDEFTWTVAEDNMLHVTWVSLHGYADTEEDEEHEGEGGLIVTSGKEEEIPFTLGEQELPTFGLVPDGQGQFKGDVRPEMTRTLRLDIGQHMIFDDDDVLRYVRAPGDFAEEREYWRQTVETYDPFGGGTPVWITTEQGWVQTPLVAGKKVGPPATSMPVTLISGMTLLLIFGILGQVGMLADYGRALMPPPLRIGLHMVPLLIYLGGAEDFESPRWQRIARVAQQIGAVWFLLITLFAVILLLSGFRPDGWWLMLLFVACGLVPCGKVLLGKE